MSGRAGGDAFLPGGAGVGSEPNANSMPVLGSKTRARGLEETGIFASTWNVRRSKMLIWAARPSLT
jgi:hypothetical protein